MLIGRGAPRRSGGCRAGRQSLPAAACPDRWPRAGPQARRASWPSGPASRGGRLLFEVRFWARTKNFGPVSRSISIRAGSTPTSRAKAVLNSARRRLSTRPRIGPALRRITRARPSRGCTVALVFRALRDLVQPVDLGRGRRQVEDHGDGDQLRRHQGHDHQAQGLHEQRGAARTLHPYAFGHGVRVTLEVNM